MSSFMLVGSLIYFKIIRHEIFYVVHLVSQCMGAPRSTHDADVLHILHYVKGNLFHGLYFSSKSSLELCAYSYADWASGSMDRRFTTSYCLWLETFLIS
jgi:hypothetical protein